MEKLNNTLNERDKMIKSIVDFKYKFDSIKAYKYEEKLNNMSYQKIKKIYTKII